MVFSSPLFILLFLPIVLLIYYIVRPNMQNLILLTASLIFYSWGEPKYIVLMLVSICVNYILGLLIYKWKGDNDKKKAKGLLAFAVFLNLFLLFIFKYLNFFTNSLNVILTMFNFQKINIENINLPIGISFYTFHAISYIVDIYRNEKAAQKNPFDLGLYFAFFPQLIAGPIVRFHDIADQIISRRITLEKMNYGVKRFILGLGKKVLIANTLGSVADQIFSLNVTQLSSGLAWLGSICYTLQIYYDFSGYSDMAIGLGYMFGFKLPENFNYPYISKSIKEFWRRWHISLSTWFRDYLYIPLGGNRGPKPKSFRNLLLVFLLCGLWHGANWTFVIWGLWHGLFLVLERTKFGEYMQALWTPLRHGYTILIFLIGWVFFRANDFIHAFTFLKTMLVITSPIQSEYNVQQYMDNQFIITLCLGVIGATPWLYNIKEFFNKLTSNNLLGIKGNLLIETGKSLLIIIVLITSLMTLATTTYNPFIYYRF